MLKAKQTAVAWMLLSGGGLLVAVGPTCTTEAGATGSEPLEAFDFLLGVWEGEGSDGRFSAAEILDGSVIEERWEEESFSAIVLRSYDGERWYLTFVAAGLSPQVWEGRLDERQWRFYREWKLEGRPMVSRTYWVRGSEDRFVRVVEQSGDGGETWREHLRAAYRRRE